jgi:hypothetical protein
MDVLDRRIAVLKLVAELWVAIAGIYFFANLKAIFMPDGMTDGTLWTPLIGLGATLAATIVALVVLLRRAAVRAASAKQ